MKTFIGLILIVSSSLALAEPPSTFSAGKKEAKKLWETIGKNSFYCDCAYRGVTPEERAVNSRLGSLRIIPESRNL